ncbi:DUF2520 domain-containing protein [Candidatus Acetothermia bacterium]|nr:DUF2520 domain-containing protein [Candidatus Acetothermia bacterium]MCI2427181.1 DUF2520 domain-containing protein [Candidatus Acetothermia bacterium]MCI2428059.1 DUF2520 domain-containing protein [Candidatus Acetothermia bacterium]
MNEKQIKLGFIGAGRVGTALATTLATRGYRITAVASRSHTSAARLAGMINGCHICTTLQQVAENADVIFITTPDDSIATVAASIAWQPHHWVIHCSGTHSLAVLAAAREKGAMVGSLHPLQSFADVAQAQANLPGSFFAIEAEGILFAFLKAIVSTLDGTSIVLQGRDKVLYHIAAVFACNYVVTLIKLAVDLWQSFAEPVEPTQAMAALTPLLNGMINNINTLGLPHALTGPISRGDKETISKHLRALEEHAPTLVELYKELGRQTIPIALAKGKLDNITAMKLYDLLANKE